MVKQPVNRLFKLAGLVLAAMLLVPTVNAQVMCTPDDITDQYWERLQALENQENAWLNKHGKGLDRADKAALAAKRQIPRQKLYRKMIALDKAARAADKKGDSDLACDKSLELDEVIIKLVDLMESQLEPPEQKLATAD